jgi:formylglycine-generating enzyme required for sulfatase activity
MKKTITNGKKISFSLFLIGFMLGLTFQSNANNLSIGTPAVVGSNIQFTVSWDNSWFTTLGSNNYDAVWIFVKRQTCTDNLWLHAPLSTNSADHSVTGGLVQVDAVADGMGVYIRRNAVGAGAIPTATVTLALQTAANTIDNFQIHGIEMVFVPQGSFLIGNGSNCQFANITIDATAENSGLNATAFNNVAGCVNQYFTSVPAAFPVGFNAFYSMKYEISQDQYAAFLNTLTYTQQVVRMAVSPNSTIGTPVMGATNRNGLRIQTPGVVSNVPAVVGCDLNANGVFGENADGQNVACGWLSWQDMIAYLDWAAMRPMTEFEYEKLCRGTEPYFPGTEYAWGTPSLIQATSAALTNAGTPSEISTASGAGLCAYGLNTPTAGPLRSGFAAALTTRQQAGAGFYGNMDLSGNLAEQCIGGANNNTQAASFTTANGNGNILSTGFADVAGWPFIGGGSTGTCYRGGGFLDAAGTLQIGDRQGRNTNSGRLAQVGGRGVRN